MNSQPDGKQMQRTRHCSSGASPLICVLGRFAPWLGLKEKSKWARTR
jgi:hypothetical protein